MTRGIFVSVFKVFLIIHNLEAENCAVPKIANSIIKGGDDRTLEPYTEMTPGSVISVKCRQDYLITEGADKGICQGNGYWFLVSPTIGESDRWARCRYDTQLNERCGVGTFGKIQGGEIVGLGELPWMARLTVNVRRRRLIRRLPCGGSLIDKHWILTAAHCVRGVGSIRSVSVSLGRVNNSAVQDQYEQDFSVRTDEIIVHPQYGKNGIYSYDYALLRLHDPVTLGEKVRKICLPKTLCSQGSPTPVLGATAQSNGFIPHIVEGCQQVTSAGWGLNETNHPTDELRKVSLTVYGSETCSANHQEICAGSHMDKVDTCFGDSGGPLMCSVNGTTFAIGIVSHGEGCGDYSKPGTYSRVCRVLDWISQIVNGSLFTECPIEGPSVDNGKLVGNSTTIGSSRDVVCNTGFEVNGANVILCLDNEWTTPGSCIHSSDDSARKIIEYPGDGQDYGPNDFKSWEIRVPEGNAIKFTLIFQQFDEIGDYLMLKDINSTEQTMPIKQPFNTGDLVFYSLKNEAKLYFRSDNDSDVGKGFLVWYEPFKLESKESEDDVVDCETWLARGNTDDGIFDIYPRGAGKTSVRTFCDMQSEGGGWTVVQRRIDSRQSFNQPWESYKNGFGRLNESFWLGNKYLHEVTMASGFPRRNYYHLRVKAKTEAGKTVGFAMKEFFIEKESENYRIHFNEKPVCNTTNVGKVFGISRNSLPFANGSVFCRYQDGVVYRHNHREFSTVDRDNDDYPQNHCAESFGKGGWWYRRCYELNLNGLFGETFETGGVTWWEVRDIYGRVEKLVETEISIRRGKMSNCSFRVQQPDHCPALTVRNGLVETGQGGVRAKGRFIIRCNLGYTLIGSRNFVKCRQNGRWSTAGRCGRARTTTISYPSGNRVNYNSNEYKCWNVSVPSGNAIKFTLEFQHFDSGRYGQADWEYLELVDTSSDRVMYSYIKQPGNAVYDRAGLVFYSVEPRAKLCFRSDDDQDVGKGFRVSYKPFRFDVLPNQKMIVDCEALQTSENATTSGRYDLYPMGRRNFAIRGFCDMETAGGGWTVIQRRVDESQRFDLPWSTYKKGFGQLDSNFWLGNDVIHQLTMGSGFPRQKYYHLLMKAYTNKNETFTILLKNFFVENEASNYRIHFDNTPVCNNTDIYNHRNFSTFDRDNDDDADRERSVYAGYAGWWYRTSETSSTSMALETVSRNLNDSLIAFWPLDEKSGVFDVVQNYRRVWLNSGSRPFIGPFDKPRSSYYANGQLAFFSGIFLSPDFTVSFYLKTLCNRRGGVLSFFNNVAPDVHLSEKTGFGIIYDKPNILEVTSGSNVLGSFPIIDRSQWNFFAVTYSSNRVTVYANNGSVIAEATDATLAGSDGLFYLGSTYDWLGNQNNLASNDRLALVRYFDKALSGNEIEQLAAFDRTTPTLSTKTRPSATTHKRNCYEINLNAVIGKSSVEQGNRWPGTSESTTVIVKTEMMIRAKSIENCNEL